MLDFTLVSWTTFPRTPQVQGQGLHPLPRYKSSSLLLYLYFKEHVTGGRQQGSISVKNTTDFNTHIRYILAICIVWVTPRGMLLSLKCWLFPQYMNNSFIFKCQQYYSIIVLQKEETFLFLQYAFFLFLGIICVSGLPEVSSPWNKKNMGQQNGNRELS